MFGLPDGILGACCGGGAPGIGGAPPGGAFDPLTDLSLGIPPARMSPS